MRVGCLIKMGVGCAMSKSLGIGSSLVAIEMLGHVPSSLNKFINNEKWNKMNI